MSYSVLCHAPSECGTYLHHKPSLEYSGKTILNTPMTSVRVKNLHGVSITFALACHPVSHLLGYHSRLLVNGLALY